MSAPPAERSREKHECVGSEHDHAVGENVRRIGRGGHRAKRLERDPSRANDRTVIQTRGFGPFCGDEPAEADTDDGRNASKDGREEAPPQEREDDRDRESSEDSGPADRRSRSWSCDPSSVGDVATGESPEKETDPRGLRGSVGSRKVPVARKQNATR